MKKRRTMAHGKTTEVTETLLQMPGATGSGIGKETFSLETEGRWPAGYLCFRLQNSWPV